MVPDVSKNRSAFIFNGNDNKEHALTLDDNGTTAFRYVGNNSPHDAVSHTTRPESSE
jgi:hypothetical protein